MKEAAPTVIAALHDLALARERTVGMLARRLGNRQLAEDAFQEAFARALERSQDLREPGRVEAWFASIVRTAAVDRARRSGLEARVLERVAELADDAVAPASFRRGCACVAGALALLRPAYAEVIRAVDLSEESLADFAAREGISANNAAVRLHRARAALRDRLRRICGGCAANKCADCRCKHAPSGRVPS